MKKSMIALGALGLGFLINCSSCFVRGTRIVTPKGMRRIEDIAVGDEVFSMNVETQTLVVRKVEKLLRSFSRELLHVAVGELVVVGVTPEHPFYNVDENQWTRASELRVGTHLTAWLGSSNVRTIAVSEHRQVEVKGSVEVFNLTIEGPEHNYFAEGLLVHNKDIANSAEGGGGERPFAGSPCNSDADCAASGLFCGKTLAGTCGAQIIRACASRESCENGPLQTVCDCNGKLHATRYQCPGDDQVIIDKRPEACAPPAGQINCGTGTCAIDTEYCFEDFTEIKCLPLPMACQGATASCACLETSGISSCDCVQQNAGGLTLRACKAP